MDKIPSFTVNHLKLLRGIYVSRKDKINDSVLTTFDLRMKTPNKEPVMNMAEMHTIEHIGATFLRNHNQWAERTIYFGPMGCRTGFYTIFKGDLTSKDIIDIIKEMFKFICEYEGEIPGALARDCGNYLDMNLNMAKYEAKKYYNEVLQNLKDDNLIYPE